MSYTILHTEWSMGWGGQEIRILAESKAFRERGYRMLIACHPESRLMEKAAEAGVPVFPLPIRKGPELRSVLATRRLIREQQVGLVHTHSSVDAWKCGMAAKSMGIPVVRSRHLSTPIKRSPLSFFVYMQLADKVITSGAAIRDTMISRNRMRAGQIVSVPAGIDERRFRPDISGDGVRDEFNIAREAFVVGIVAVLRRWKGHHLLLDAVASLRREGLDLTLLIVGDGPQRSNLERQILQLELESHAIMTGHRQDVPECMAAMDCVVLPSMKNEATSQVLPQAMAMKKPVIATDVGGLAEVVIHEKTGLLVPGDDTAALAKAIRRLREDRNLAARLAQSGYEHVLRGFTFDKMISDTEQVYLSLLRKSGQAMGTATGSSH